MTAGNAGDFSFSISLDQQAATRDFESFKAKTTGGLKSIDQATKPTAKALGAMSGALGSAGVAGAGFARGLGDIAGLLAGGGGLALALTATVAVVGKVAEAFGEARESAKTFGQAVDAAITSQAQARIDSLADLQKGVLALERQVRDFGKSGELVLVETLRQRKEANEAALVRAQRQLAIVEEQAKRSGVEASVLRREGVADTAEMDAMRVKALSATVDRINKDLKATSTELERAEKLAIDLAFRRAEEGEPARKKQEQQEAERIAKEAAARRKAIDDEREKERAAIEAHEKMLRQQQERAEAEREAELYAATERRLEIAREEAKEKQVIAEHHNKWMQIAERNRINEAKRAHKEAQDEIIGATRAASATAASAGLVFVDALFAGEKLEQALLHAVDMIARQAGSFTIGKGIEAMANGMALLSNPISAPAAPAAFAIGGTLLAAGVALGGVVPGAIGMLAGGGGGGTQGVDRFDGGVNMPSPTSGPRSDDGGPVVINISYGVTGPRADETAALVSDSLRVARRRGHA
jgi:hypothetical protein